MQKIRFSEQIHKILTIFSPRQILHLTFKVTKQEIKNRLALIFAG